MTVRARLPATEHLVSANRVNLEQVVMNLVLNTRDAMPDGGTVTIEVDAAAPPADPTTAPLAPRRDGYASLVVRDTGAGMTRGHGPVGDPITSGRVRLSPDGARFVSYMYDVDNADLWLVDAASGTRERLTTSPAWEWWGVWSPDGSRIAYTGVTHDLTSAIYVRPSVPGSQETHLTDANGDVWPSSWSADGRWIAYSESSGADQRNLYAIDVEQPENRLVIYEGSGDGATADFHPLLPVVVYQLDDELWIASFPEMSDARQITSSGGTAPRWSPAGDELFYWRLELPRFRGHRDHYRDH